MADFPDICASDYSFILAFNTQSYESPLTRSVQTSSLLGDQWQGVVTFTNKADDDARTLKAFILGLKGQVGRFNFSPPDLNQQGQGTAAITVDGAGQLGGTIDIQTADLNTLLFGIGDYMEVNGELKTVLADVTSNGSGLATVTFVPNLRQSPPDSAVVEFEDPRVIMKLEDDAQTTFQVSSPVIYNATFSLLEAF